MDKPAVFTAEEVARFRAEIASRRVPGAYEPGCWSVSPLNRDPSVAGTMPSSMRLRDSTLRSIETMPGVVADEAAKSGYLRRLVEAGVSEVLGAGALRRSAEELQAEVEIIKTAAEQCRAVCPLVFSEADIDRVAAAGFDAVQVWVQGFGETAQIYRLIYDTAWRGEDWRTTMPIQSRAEILATARRLVSHARSAGLDAITPMLMVSYLDDEVLEDTVEALTSAGATELTLFDGPGALGPEAFALLVGKVRRLAPQVDIGLHPHNTFGMAVACAVSAVRAGAGVVEVSVNGYCGGPGNADLAATAVAFETLYGVRTGMRSEMLTGLARAGEELTGYHVAWNHPVTGVKTFNWGGLDIITQEVAVDPLLHNCLEPARVGNVRSVPFTPYSGPYTLADKLEELGFRELSRSEVDQILVEARAEMSRGGSMLTDEQLAGIARSAMETPG